MLSPSVSSVGMGRYPFIGHQLTRSLAHQFAKCLWRQWITFMWTCIWNNRQWLLYICDEIHHERVESAAASVITGRWKIFAIGWFRRLSRFLLKHFWRQRMSHPVEKGWIRCGQRSLSIAPKNATFGWTPTSPIFHRHSTYQHLPFLYPCLCGFYRPAVAYWLPLSIIIK